METVVTTYQYNKNYFKSGMNGWHSQSFEIISKNFDDFFKDKLIDRLLDFGCGDGFYGGYLKQYATSVTGMDISNELQEGENKIYYDEFIRADLAGNLNTDCKYDVIFSSEVIEHVQDYDAFLSNACNLTKAKGVLFLTTTTYLGSLFIYLTSGKKIRFNQILFYFKGLFGNKKYRTEFLKNNWEWTKGHFHGFSKSQIRKALVKAGYENITIKFLYIHPLIYNEFFLNPFKNVRFRIAVIIVMRTLYRITQFLNFLYRITKLHGGNILVTANKS